MKTDSWLIRTLNNASVVSKRCKDDADGRSSESSNSSETAYVKPDQLASSLITDEDTRTSTTIVDSEYPAISSRERVSNSFAKSGETSAKESEKYIGRATYSETVRRSVKSNNTHSDRKEPCKYTTGSSMAIVMPIPNRKNPRKDFEYSYQLLQKSQKSTDKKAARTTDGNDVQVDEGLCAKISSGVRSNSVTLKTATVTKTHGRKKDLEAGESKCAGKSGDRGWSVWYSSRKKQSLSPLALSKLETIHQTVWQMDEAKIFRYPLSRENKEHPSTEIVSFRIVRI